jgi:hypothetical protein
VNYRHYVIISKQDRFALGFCRFGGPMPIPPQVEQGPVAIQFSAVRVSQRTMYRMIVLAAFMACVYDAVLDEVQAFRLKSLFPGKFHLKQLIRKEQQHQGQFVVMSALLLSKETSTDSPRIEGLMRQDEYDRLNAVDKTINELSIQLPAILTKPLNTQSAEKVFSKTNFRLIVQVDNADSDDRILEADGDADIVVLQGQKDLIALSDVLVLAIAAAQQANAAISGGAADTTTDVMLQIVMDDTFQVLRIPWKATAPVLGSPNSNIFEGVTDCFLSRGGSGGGGGGGIGSEDLGKVEKFVIRKLTWNGRSLNGPAIGQALRAVQSTVSSLRQSPIFRNFVGSNESRDRTTSFLNSLRDGLLDQAAGAISSQQPVFGDPSSLANQSTKVQIIHVTSMGKKVGWMDEKEISQATTNISVSNTICPGTEDWVQYSESRACLCQFYQDIIPQLSDLSIVDPDLFSKNATYQSDDGSVLMRGSETLADYFQSLALTRKATGGTWIMIQCKVIDWRKREVLVVYEATVNGLPQWKIRGSDIYCLADSHKMERTSIISNIRHQTMTVVNEKGIETPLDSQWLIKNLAGAFDREGSGKASRDFLTEILMQQPGMRAALKDSNVTPKAGKNLSQTVAAKCYYIMADLLEHSAAIFDISSNRVTPPACEYMDDNVVLRGYLGESILRGRNLYDRSIGSVIFGCRDSIRQKRIVIEKVVPSRVELLMPWGDIRLSQVFEFRISTPGAGILLLPESMASPPITIELVSDYKISPTNGLITEHRLVETRVNGQLTPGDQVSRWIQRFLITGPEGPARTGFGENENNDNVLRAISDMLKFFRSINSEEERRRK